MLPLDEDLSNKITYTSECQATFQKYKRKIISKIIRIVGVGLVISLILLRLIVFGIANLSIGQLAIMFFVSFVFFVFFINLQFYPKFLLLKLLLLNFLLLKLLIKDLKIKKLDIKTDVYLDRVVKEKSDTEVEYIGIFQEAGEILSISEEIIKQLKRNTKVYIVRTVFSKTLLDIIPADKIDHPT